MADLKQDKERKGLIHMFCGFQLSNIISAECNSVRRIQKEEARYIVDNAKQVVNVLIEQDLF